MYSVSFLVRHSIKSIPRAENAKVPFQKSRKVIITEEHAKLVLFDYAMDVKKTAESQLRRAFREEKILECLSYTRSLK